MTNNKGYCGISADCVPQIDGGSGFKNCEEAHAAQQEEDFSTPPSEMFECDVCGCITDAPEGMHYCYEDNSDD